jgi:hypothetical protein
MLDSRSNRRTRVYRMTVWTGIAYHEGEEGAKSLECHYTAALPGDLHEVRQDLADFGINNFLRTFEELHGYKPSPSAVKVRFEAEQTALAPTEEIQVETLEITYRGKQHYARRFAPRTMRYNYDPDSYCDEDEDDADEDDEWDDDDGDFDDS